MPRPSKYDPKYCEQLIKHCSQGYSFETFAHKIGITDRTLRNWRDTHQEFHEASERASNAAMYFYERKLIQGITGDKRLSSKANTTLLIFALKTRFHKQYSQRVKVATDEKVEVNVPGSLTFKGRKTTVAELSGEELAEAEAEISQKIEETRAKIERWKTEPDPLDGYENTFL